MDCSVAQTTSTQTSTNVRFEFVQFVFFIQQLHLWALSPPFHFPVSTSTASSQSKQTCKNSSLISEKLAANEFKEFLSKNTSYGLKKNYHFNALD